MARIKQLQHEIKARIEEIPELVGLAVVYKSATVEADFKTRMSKVRGKAAIIRLMSASNQSDTKVSKFACTILVSLFVVPSLKPGKDCETLMMEIEAKLHGWWPDAVASNTTQFLKSDNVSFPDDAVYDIGVLTIKTPPLPLI